MKRTNFSIIAILALLLGSNGCTNFLEIEPKDRLSGNALLSSDEGIMSYMASLYDKLPIEDFKYDYRIGFNYGGNSGGMMNANLTRDAIHSEWGDHAGQPERFGYWDPAYSYIRDINNLQENIPLMKPSDPAALETIQGEKHFFKAYAYFQLAKRYGGVPIIHRIQDFNGDYATVRIPRSTERETWDYVIAQCDTAISLLPDANGKRATKWVAQALKSRAALFAASVAKFWDAAPLAGQAVEQKLVGGLSTDDAARYYQACIDASAAIIKSGKFELFKREPASFGEAAENYRTLFSAPQNAGSEVIFSRGYAYPGKGHSMGTWHQPNQLSKEFGGRLCITLDLVDAYETIDGNGVGSKTSAAKLKTRADGNENYSGFDNAGGFLKYDHPHELFADKDPRLFGTVLLPKDVWKGTEIIIQGGLVRADGSAIWLANDPYEFQGETYYGKGDARESYFSGWVNSRSNGTITGFLLKKFLTEGNDQEFNQVTTEFIDFRYAEILLNYAEAIAESGLPAPAGIPGAEEALNETRHRAGFTDTLPLSAENVQRERRVEMALEYTSVWDYVRRREFHSIFNGTYNRHALVPMLDFTVSPAQYIFVRYELPEPGGSKRFETRNYYRPIPGLENNFLIQNPGY